jgi:hypothetical protein
VEILAYAPEPCPCRRPVTGRKLLACVRSSKALNRDRKATRDVAQVQRDMVRMRRLLMVEGMRTMMVMMRAHLEGTMAAFVERVLSRMNQQSAETPGRKAEPDPTSVEFVFNVGGANEAIWANALNEILGEAANVRLVLEYQPVAQSIAARAYERTSIIIGEELAPDANISILRRAQTLAREVTQINDTTRKVLAERLARGVEEGSTPREIAKAIEAEIPEIAAKRLPTIVRTEVGRALDEGTKQAMLESSVITHVSVIGCKAREANSPQYNGQSTCNIADVPVYDVDKLRWHPNHTGALVPSRFVGER